MEAVEIIEAVSSNPLTMAGVLSLIVIAIVKGWLIPLSTFKVLEATWKEAIERERDISKRLSESLKVGNEQAELTLSLLSKLPRDESQNNSKPPRGENNHTSCPLMDEKPHRDTKRPKNHSSAEREEEQ